MGIKAVSFDVGHTLVRYNNPLNWTSLYAPALKKVLECCRLEYSDERVRQAAAVLSKYNTRENPREYEVRSDMIFSEIFALWGEDCKRINTAKESFYSFFQADAVCFDDAAETLRFLHDRGIKRGALTDVAYGMDNAFALQDIEPIREYFDLVLTSVDVGFRKPHKAGYERLLQSFNAAPEEMLYVGDEEKDIIGANRLGIVSVLIDRNNKCPQYGQNFTIGSLRDICLLIEPAN